MAETETVPVERFNELVNERNALKAELGKSQEKAATVDTLARQVDELKGALKTERSTWEQERAIFQAGITDPDGIEVAKLVYGRLPEDKRPKSVAEFLTGLKAEGAEVPRALQPWLTPAAAPGAPAAGGARPAPRPAPTPPGGTAPQAPPTVTQEAIKNARDKFQKTHSDADRKALEELLRAFNNQKRA